MRSIYQDRQGDLWFGTFGGGVGHYDGKVFQTLTRRDGLAGNDVLAILQDRDGNMWFSSISGGVTRYRPSKASPPAVVIEAVVADRRYERPADLSVPSTVARVEFEFNAMSIKTRPGAMVYRYRLRGHEDEWQNANARRVEYQDLLAGDYTFEVEAIDRDLVYSESQATLPLTISPSP